MGHRRGNTIRGGRFVARLTLVVALTVACLLAWPEAADARKNSPRKSASGHHAKVAPKVAPKAAVEPSAKRSSKAAKRGQGQEVGDKVQNAKLGEEPAKLGAAYGEVRRCRLTSA